MSEVALMTRHGALPVPAFFPDATRAVVRALDAGDLEECGVPVMVNILHLSTHPGISVVGSLNGVHRFMGWQRPLASDSGGFQILSLIGENPSLGSVSEKGFSYRLAPGAEKEMLTPEKCIEKQMRLGSDILFCLDYCTHPEASPEQQQESVRLTVLWARRCKEAFRHEVEQRKLADHPPLLFAVVQGGNNPELRRACVEQLGEIGFDGYGYGGWPIDAAGNCFRR